MSFYDFSDFVSANSTKASNAYDHLFGNPTPFDLLAPHPDLFESELDSSADLGELSALDISRYPILDQANPAFYSDFRSGYTGPGSTITVSSESQSGYEYDNVSFYSSRDSSSGYIPATDNAFPRRPSTYGSDIDLDFAEFKLAAPATNPITPPTMPRIPSLAGLGLDHFDVRRGGPTSAPAAVTAAPQYYQSSGSPTATGHNDSDSSRSRSPVQESVSERDQRLTDAGPPKKYACPNCTRSFARAFNLKTHLATHDPHRVKSFVCRHPGCGRSFSRKHDLGRHLTSIHAAAALSEAGAASSSSSVVGGSGHRANASDVEASAPTVANAPFGGEKSMNRNRVWCDGCGRGWLKGTREACACEGNTRD